MSEREQRARTFVWAAGASGTLHAAASLYWALGGQWLLATVGQWAVERSAEAPLSTGLGLGTIALLKLLAAVIPIGVAYGKVGRARLWRAVSWVGGLALIAYGGVNTIVASAVLAGAIRPEDGYDRDAMIGHALLWDPLFTIWGAALILSLWFSRTRGGGGDASTRSTRRRATSGRAHLRSGQSPASFD